MVHKKEVRALINELKGLVIRKCTYLLSKKIIIEDEAYSLMKLFFKGYLEIDHELSFVDILSKVNDLNIDTKIKVNALTFLDKLSESLYSGRNFSQEELHVLIRNFQIIVDNLIGEKKEQSLVDKSMEKVIKLPFIKNLFVRKKGLVIEEEIKPKEKKYSSVREKLIDKIKDIANEENIVENKTVTFTDGKKLDNKVIQENKVITQEKESLQIVPKPKNIIKQTEEVIPDTNWVSNEISDKSDQGDNRKLENNSNFVNDPQGHYNVDFGMFEETPQAPPPQNNFSSRTTKSNLADATTAKVEPSSTFSGVIKDEIKNVVKERNIIEEKISEREKVNKTDKERPNVLGDLVSAERVVDAFDSRVDDLDVVKKERVKALGDLVSAERAIDILKKHIDSVDIAKKKEILKKLIKIEFMEDYLSNKLDLEIKEKPTKFDDTHIDAHLDKIINDGNVVVKMNNFLNKMQDKKVKLLEMIKPPEQKVISNKETGQDNKFALISTKNNNFKEDLQMTKESKKEERIEDKPTSSSELNTIKSFLGEEVITIDEPESESSLFSSSSSSARGDVNYQDLDYNTIIAETKAFLDSNSKKSTTKS